MVQGLQHLHNLMRWVILILAVLTLVKSFSGMSNKKAFTAGNRKTALFLMISADVQLLLGLLLYMMKGWMSSFSQGGVMANAVSRFWAVEHIFGMIVGLVLIHLGFSAAKKNTDDATKFKKLFWFTLIALVVILATIPWPFRVEGVGRPWFPGMN
jgi:uncharacterized membrane protein